MTADLGGGRGGYKIKEEAVNSRSILVSLHNAAPPPLSLLESITLTLPESPAEHYIYLVS